MSDLRLTFYSKSTASIAGFYCVATIVCCVRDRHANSAPQSQRWNPCKKVPKSTDWTRQSAKTKPFAHRFFHGRPPCFRSFIQLVRGTRRTSTVFGYSRGRPSSRPKSSPSDGAVVSRICSAFPRPLLRGPTEVACDPARPPLFQASLTPDRRAGIAVCVEAPYI